ncbi:MAG: VOC family protein [Actinobacteria bacterium]|nr:VOC family protein [Actinomycetota bacterium]
MSQLMPMLAYEEAAKAIDFLISAFGFEETMRMDGENGTIAHAELSLNGAMVSLASVWRDGGLATPHELGGVHSQLWVEVDDIDAHFQKARAAGAVVLDEPVSQDGYKTYRAIDPEGHRWYFAGAV